jgi:hypothetical protein
VLAAGGVLYRSPGLDARVTLAARYRVSERVGVHVEAGLSPVPGTAITVYDGALLLGAGLMLADLKWLNVEAGLSLGVALHSYSLADPSAQDRFGTRVDFAARPFLRLVACPFPAASTGVLLWAQAGAGVTTRAREHRLLDEVLYYRGALWIDAQAGLGIRL